MYVRYLLSAPMSLTFNLITMLVSPLLAALAATFRWANLPGPLAYFQTHDDWLYGFGWPKPTVPDTWGKRFRIATWWLFRNPGYGFDAFVLGYPPGIGHPWSFPEQNGRDFHRFVSADGTQLFSFRWEFPISDSRYCKIWLGWKPNVVAGRHMIVLDINPFKRRS